MTLVCLNLVLNMLMITTYALSKDNHNYCRPLWQSLISVQDNMLILTEPICGNALYKCLQFFAHKLYNLMQILLVNMSTHS